MVWEEHSVDNWGLACYGKIGPACPLHCKLEDLPAMGGPDRAAMPLTRVNRPKACKGREAFNPKGPTHIHSFRSYHFWAEPKEVGNQIK